MAVAVSLGNTSSEAPVSSEVISSPWAALAKKSKSICDTKGSRYSKCPVTALDFRLVQLSMETVTGRKISSCAGAYIGLSTLVIGTAVRKHERNNSGLDHAGFSVIVIWQTTSNLRMPETIPRYVLDFEA